MSTAALGRILQALCISLTMIAPLQVIAFPRAPIIIRDSAGDCKPHTEICGNSVDEDCNGADLPCSGSDKDRDGFPASADCDDLNKFVYPGVSVDCSAGCGVGTKTCGSTGQFSSCSCTPLCEATGTGKCYYISLLTGSDSNAGTFQNPWRTYANINSYANSAQRPAKWVQLKGGDVVYFLSGVYQESWVFDWPVGLMVLGINGSSATPLKIKAYPGSSVVFSPPNANGLRIQGSSYVEVEGIEFNKTQGDALNLFSSSNVTLSNLWVHDNDGQDNHNTSGVKFTDMSYSTLRNSIVHDNYDRTCADTGGSKTENSRNVVLFGGGFNKIVYSTFFNSVPTSAQKTGACIGYKHASRLPNSTFLVEGNSFLNCWDSSIGTGTEGSIIRRNIIVDSAPIQLRNYGGETFIRNELIENNTLLRSGALNYNMVGTYWDAIGMVTFRKNVISDTGSYGTEGGLLRISPYATAAFYQLAVVGENLSFNDNCYFNPTTQVKHNLAYWLTGFGGLYNLTQWKAKGYDLDSSEVDPQFAPDLSTGNSACSGKGALAGN